MSDRPTVLHGVIHGKTIELKQEPGVPEGQRVQVEIRPAEETRGQCPPPEEPRAGWNGWMSIPPSRRENS